MSAEPLFGKRALVISDYALVIADLHIGVEYELEKKGIKVPLQWKVMADEIKEMEEESGTEILIINGDLKHGIPAEKWEFRDLRLFMIEMKEIFKEIHVVMGNHDGAIQNKLPSWVKIHKGSGFVLKGYGILHGHAWPSEELDSAHTFIIGHTHPSMLFTDSLGNSRKEPCWIRGKYGDKDLVVMPAMSRFYGGSPVNKGELLGPILNSKDFDAENSEVYLLDGTYIGKLGEIKKRGDGPPEVG